MYLELLLWTLINKYLWFDEIKLSTELKQCDWLYGLKDEMMESMSDTLTYYNTCTGTWPATYREKHTQSWMFIGFSVDDFQNNW